MKVRFQADADLDRRTVRATRRRERAISFQLATEARSGVGLSSMPQNFAHFTSAVTSPRVIIVPQNMPLGGLMIRCWLQPPAKGACS